jgi:hypothetical protein
MTSGTWDRACASPTVWLGLWLINNVAVTLLNKAAFSSVHFNYPMTLSLIHMLCSGIGCRIFYTRPVKSLSSEARKQILLFSIIFTLNIAVGNVSLKYVSVNFNQVMRSLVPGLTLLVGLWQGKPFTLIKALSVVPIIVGVAMACFGDMTYTAVGFLVTVGCVILAAAKVVCGGEMLRGEAQLQPMELLDWMAPLAAGQCLLLALTTGEISAIYYSWPQVNTRGVWMMVMGSGVASFTLNVSSLIANKLTSPLTLCIAANVKQVLMIVVSTLVFETEVTVLNGMGILLVLLASANYSFITLSEKAKVAPEPRPVDKAADAV